jgi:hypothetical protein
VTHGTEFQPSPRRPRNRRKTRRATQARATLSALNTVPERPPDGDESNEEEVVVSLLGNNAAEELSQRDTRSPVIEAAFGRELTNSPNKRGGAYMEKRSPVKPRRGESEINGGYNNPGEVCS